MQIRRIVLLLFVIILLMSVQTSVSMAQNQCGEGEEPVFEQTEECRDGFITLVTNLYCCAPEVDCYLVGEVSARPTTEVCLVPEPSFAPGMMMIRYTGPAQWLNWLSSSGVQWCHKGTRLPGVIPVEAVQRTNNQIMATEWVPQVDYPAVNGDLNPANYGVVIPGGYCTQPLTGWYEWMRSHLTEEGIGLGGTALFVD